MKIFLIRPDNTGKEIKPEEWKKLPVDGLQSLVGGYVEHIRFKGSRAVCGDEVFTSGEMYVDEDGRAKGLPVNPRASEIFGAQILGNVVVVFKKGRKA